MRSHFVVGVSGSLPMLLLQGLHVSDRHRLTPSAPLYFYLMHCQRSRRAALLAIACLGLFGSSGGAQASRYDILITGGTLVDGSGASRRPGDVAIKDGKIAAVGLLPKATATQVIDASGLVGGPRLYRRSYTR